MTLDLEWQGRRVRLERAVKSPESTGELPGARPWRIVEPFVHPADEAAVARYKGDVPALILVFHVSFMIIGMFFSTSCGLTGLLGGSAALRPLSMLSFLFLLLGGCILGPIVQKYAFDAYWTGWPLGSDWTDNKLAVGALAWLAAAWRCRGAREGRPVGRWWAFVAMLAIIVIYSIPHSIHGSTLDYETGEHIQALVAPLRSPAG